MTPCNNYIPPVSWPPTHPAPQTSAESSGYLIDLIAIKEQPRYNLRSASGHILKYASFPPSLKLKKTLGGRSFSSAAPNLWNNLPLHIRLEDNFERFKSLLKTHLFRQAFDM